MEGNAVNEKIEKQTKEASDIVMHKDVALQKLNTLMSTYIKNPNLISNADKLAYWLEDYCRFLNFEKNFKPCMLKTYKRGDIIKVNLGYNVGNEEGGLHYCVVIDKNNSKNSGIITVIPLTSDKGKPRHFSEVFLGNEIYTNFINKYSSIRLSLTSHINNISKYRKEDTPSIEAVDEIIETLDLLKTWAKIENEIAKMKSGSIALVSQITTISKQRIYDPQKTGDILSGLRISDESLDLINKKIKQLFIKD